MHCASKRSFITFANSLLCLVQNATAETAESAADVPFLLVSKSVKIKKIKENDEDISVNIKIYNAGGSIAYDVSLDDENWPSDLFEVVGNTTHSWDSLAMGTAVSHTYVVKPKEKGTFVTPPATVKFRVTSKAQLLTAKSTGVPELDLLAPVDQAAKYRWLKDLAIQFGPLVGAISLVVVALLIVFAPITSKKSSKKRR
ncbi:unnamed protein product [Closterium sp. Yama58-4]|nr:unnamed protein product [Closterium sp. Yama58-4]